MKEPALESDTDSRRIAGGHASRLARWGGYFFWNAAGLVLALGIDRLVVHPALAPCLGQDVFGAFIYVLGLVNLVGTVGANGFAIIMQREYARQSKDDARAMVRTSIALSVAISAAILAVTLTVCLISATDEVRDHAWQLYIPLALYAIIRSVQHVIATQLGIDRRFALLFVLRVLEALILVVNLAVAPMGSLWAIGGVYVASVLAPVIASVFTSRQVLGAGRLINEAIAKLLMRGWWGGAAITLTEQVQVYASRLILGQFWAMGEVAVLYAGTSIANLFNSPVGMAGGLVLSILAGQRNQAFVGRRRTVYLLVTMGCAVAVGVVSYAVGRWIILWAYPSFGPETLEFYAWIAIANGLTAAMLLLRPVVVRYLPLRRVTLASFSTAAVQVIALVVAVPAFGAKGAAVSLAISSAVAFGQWLRLYWQSASIGGSMGEDQMETGLTGRTQEELA